MLLIRNYFTGMTFIKFLWNKWKLIAHKIGLFQSRLILTIFYFTILIPAGLIYTILKNEMGIKSKSKTTWISKKHLNETLETMRKQY